MVSEKLLNYRAGIIPAGAEYYFLYGCRNYDCHRTLSFCHPVCDRRRNNYTTAYKDLQRYKRDNYLFL